MSTIVAQKKVKNGLAKVWTGVNIAPNVLE